MIKNIKTLAILIVCMIGCVAGVQAADTSKPKADFKEKSFDFGIIPSGSKPVSHEFEFTNAGEGNLVIAGVRAACGCTKPEYPLAPIPKGQTARIKVTFNPAGFRGAFEKEVTLTTNGNPKRVKLRIKGIIR